eukprot:TRINITY_DN10750_c0_g1_i2.p1 TRINITY_DN10750_c0_g1~~TRINITY_DN10750_c0_g1_i2.p1  ORF type:complete len:412 (+),score=74.78 TRINITY_DN10750_c0_g1_i2:531-1766(+)
MTSTKRSSQSERTIAPWSPLVSLLQSRQPQPDARLTNTTPIARKPCDAHNYCLSLHGLSALRCVSSSDFHGMTKLILPGCSFTAGTKRDYFVAQAENFTIRIRHAVRGSTVNRQGANTGDRPMSGRIEFADGTHREWPDSQLWYGQPQNDSRSGDIMSVGELLEAVGLRSDDDGVDGGTLRYDGLNIIVYIRYEMTGSNRLRYTYEPRALSNAEYKVEQVVYTDDQLTRTIYNRHGVRFIFVQIGEIGDFDFLVLMTTLVTGLALLAVATTVTNMLMSYVLSMRMVYNKHKYEYTEDFSTWRSMDEDEKRQRLEILAHKSEGGTTHTANALGLGHNPSQPWKPDDEEDNDNNQAGAATTTFHANGQASAPPAQQHHQPQGYPQAGYPQQQYSGPYGNIPTAYPAPNSGSYA